MVQPTRLNSNQPSGLAGRRHGRAGFTLMEILLTLLLMAGIMLAITEILTRARQIRDQIHNMQERQLVGPAILDLIEHDIRAMFIYNRNPNDLLRIENRVLSGLDADKLDFVASTDSMVPFRRHEGEDFRHADINEVGYRLRVSPDSDDFLEIYRREDFGVDEEAMQGGSFTLLHDRVKGFDIQVYDEDGPDAEPIEEWGEEGGDEEHQGLPLRIEISLTLELNPRLINQTSNRDVREMTYVRTIRLPESLLLAFQVQPVPAIPVPASPNTTEVGGPAGADGLDAGGDLGGGDGGAGRGDGGGLPFDLGGGGGGGSFGG
ncbi:MAG: hypothetical protein ACI8QS_000074 [Planctomycetota bacterium]|jgi:hypothetical protein